MVKAVRHFQKETAYQLADGFSANLDYYTIHPNIGGTFASENEAHDHKEHPITFRFQELKPMRDLRNLIEVIIDGIADTKGYIMDFTDVSTGAVNEGFTNVGEFIITGYKLKVEGTHPDVGVYFQQIAGGNLNMKISKLAENTSSKLVGMWPGSPNGTYKVVLKTQYAGSGKFLKDLRVIESSFTLTK